MRQGIVHRQLRFPIHGSRRWPSALGGGAVGFRRRRESERERRAGYQRESFTQSGHWNLFAAQRLLGSFIASQSGNANYLFAMVDNGRSILFLRTDSGTVVSGKADSQALTASVLPDFAYVAGFYLAIYFANTGNTAVSFPVNFFGDAGGPLSVPSVMVQHHHQSSTAGHGDRGSAKMTGPLAGHRVDVFAERRGQLRHLPQKYDGSSRPRGDCAALRGVLHT